MKRQITQSDRFIAMSSIAKTAFDNDKNTTMNQYHGKLGDGKTGNRLYSVVNGTFIRSKSGDCIDQIVDQISDPEDTTNGSIIYVGSSGSKYLLINRGGKEVIKNVLNAMMQLLHKKQFDK